MSTSHSSHHHSSHHHSSHHHSSHHHSSSRSKRKKIFKHSLRRPLGHTIAVLLTVFVFIFFSLIAVLSGSFSKSYIRKTVTGDEYTAQVYEAQLVKATALAADFNLSKTIYNGVITQETIRQHLEEYVNSVLNGSGESVDLTAMQNALTVSIERAIVDSGLEYNDEMKAKTSNFVLAFGKTYFEGLEIPRLGTIFSLKLPFILVLVVCEVLLGLLIPICALLIDKTHRNNHKTTRQLAYIFLGSGLLTFIIPLMIRLSGYYYTIMANEEYVYNFFITYFNHIMNTWMLFALIPLAMGGGFIYWTKLRKNKLKVKS